jgi:hypothetical protein
MIFIFKLPCRTIFDSHTRKNFVVKNLYATKFNFVQRKIKKNSFRRCVEVYQSVWDSRKFLIKLYKIAYIIEGMENSSREARVENTHGWGGKADSYSQELK